MRKKGKYSPEEINLISKVSHPDDVRKIALVLNRDVDNIRKRMSRDGVKAPINIHMYSNEYPMELKAYLAGHFDADGCVRMAKKYNNVTMPYFPAIEVTISSRPTIDLYASKYGGRAWESKHSVNKQMYTWVTQSLNDMYNLIVSIIDFSIEKKEQLALVKEWIEKRVEYKASNKLPKDFIEYTHFIANEVRRLKKESSCYTLVNYKNNNDSNTRT